MRETSRASMVPTSRAKIVLISLAVATVVGVVLTLGLFVDNPTVGGTRFRDPFQCNAPYDVVLNHSGSKPDGEPPTTEGIAVGQRCTQLAERRFQLGVGSGAVTGVLALALGLSTTVLLVRRIQV
jgi:hypothetical protein